MWHHRNILTFYSWTNLIETHIVCSVVEMSVRRSCLSTLWMNGFFKVKKCVLLLCFVLSSTYLCVLSDNLQNALTCTVVNELNLDSEIFPFVSKQPVRISICTLNVYNMVVLLQSLNNCSNSCDAS